MDKKMLLQQLTQREDTYRQLRPSTAEMDITIFKAYCASKNAVQIAMSIPCAESTVYRAVRRVKEFLLDSDMNMIFETLRRKISQNLPDYGSWDANSILEMMYVTYADHNQLRPECGRTSFHTLRNLLCSLTKEHSDQVFDVVCDLCNSHERTAFTEGIKLGVRLADELAM